MSQSADETAEKAGVAKISNFTASIVNTLKKQKVHKKEKKKMNHPLQIEDATDETAHATVDHTADEAAAYTNTADEAAAYTNTADDTSPVHTKGKDIERRIKKFWNGVEQNNHYKRFQEGVRTINNIGKSKRCRVYIEEMLLNSNNKHFPNIY